MKEINKCRCGALPERLKKRTRYGMRWWIQCPKCGKRTHKHRPNGGDLYEWEKMQEIRLTVIEPS